MNEPVYEWSSVVRSLGLGLEDLGRCISRTTSWLRDRGVDPQSLGLEDIEFRTVETPEGPAIEARIRLEVPSADKMPVLIEGLALGRRFTFSYGENPLYRSGCIAIEQADGSWSSRSVSGGSLAEPNGRAFGWSSLGSLAEGVWGLAIGTDPAYVAKARLYRGPSQIGEELPLYRANSRYEVVCAATLVDAAGVEIEYLDTAGKVLQRRSYSPT